MKLIIHTDGGSRGNPGPSAIGVTISVAIGATIEKQKSAKKLLHSTHDRGKNVTIQNHKEYAEAIGETTNNIAEYSAVILALTKVKKLIGKEKSKDAEIEIKSDSELMVNQLNGTYKIKNPEIEKLFIKVWNKKQNFKHVTFIHIPREKNKRADALVNQVLNKQKLL